MTGGTVVPCHKNDCNDFNCQPLFMLDNSGVSQLLPIIGTTTKSFGCRGQ